MQLLFLPPLLSTMNAVNSRTSYLSFTPSILSAVEMEGTISKCLLNTPSHMARLPTPSTLFSPFLLPNSLTLCSHLTCLPLHLRKQSLNLVFPLPAYASVLRPVALLLNGAPLPWQPDIAVRHNPDPIHPTSYQFVLLSSLRSTVLRQLNLASPGPGIPVPGPRIYRRFDSYSTMQTPSPTQ